MKHKQELNGLQSKLKSARASAIQERDHLTVSHSAQMNALVEETQQV